MFKLFAKQHILYVLMIWDSNLQVFFCVNYFDLKVLKLSEVGRSEIYWHVLEYGHCYCL